MSTVVWTSLAANAQDGAASRERLDLGMPAPEFTFSEPIQGVAKVSLDALRGSVVVLEFWATWCSPCIPALHHMDELRSKLSGQKIEFVGVAIDTPERVKKFLEHDHFDQTLVCDVSGSYYRSFALHSVPGTVVIDRDGRIAAITRPGQVDLAVLQRVLAGQPAGLPRDESVAANADWAPAIDAEGTETWASVVIAPADPRTTMNELKSKPGSGKFSGDGLFRSNLFQLAYDVPYWRLVDGFGEWRETDAKYRIAVTAPGGDDQLGRTMLARSLEAKLGYHVRREQRETAVKVLRRVDNGQQLAVHTGPAPSGSEPTFWASGRGTHGAGQPLENLRKACESMARKPVVDETGADTKATFDWHLEWVDAPTFERALASVGLELVEAKRSLEFVVIVPDAAGTGR
ncbi:MAG TPA: redoxin domain-containing protein [Planctomycetota bacterium]|nr:redoxin domain-containing protein [Planctomycetota bacterium]